MFTTIRDLLACIRSDPNTVAYRFDPITRTSSETIIDDRLLRNLEEGLLRENHMVEEGIPSPVAAQAQLAIPPNGILRSCCQEERNRIFQYLFDSAINLCGTPHQIMISSSVVILTSATSMLFAACIAPLWSNEFFIIAVVFGVIVIFSTTMFGRCGGNTVTSVENNQLSLNNGGMV